MGLIAILPSVGIQSFLVVFEDILKKSFLVNGQHCRFLANIALQQMQSSRQLVHLGGGGGRQKNLMNCPVTAFSTIFTMLKQLSPPVNLVNNGGRFFFSNGDIPPSTSPLARALRCMCFIFISGFFFFTVSERHKRRNSVLAVFCVNLYFHALLAIKYCPCKRRERAVLKEQVPFADQYPRQ